MGMFDRITSMFNPDSVFKKEDGSLIPLNDARRILMKRATDDGMDGNDVSEFVKLRLKNLGYNQKKLLIKPALQQAA